MGSVNPSIDLAHDGDIAVVTIDNPPVNALKHEVRAGLIEAFQRVRNDAGVKAAVLACAGRTFSAGADITEFGKPRQRAGPARGHRDDRETRRSRSSRRSTARALGGGLEVALGCHYRVAAPGTRSACPRSSSASCPAPAARSACRALVGAGRRST